MTEARKFPRRWKNKRNGKTVRVMPWYEIPDPVLNEKQWSELTQMRGIKAKYGVLVQIGLLLETEAGIWLGVSSKIESDFEDLGEWKNEIETEAPKSGAI